MNEFQKYSNSEKITHMLDGELSEGESLQMQNLIAGDPELKAQMDEELKIREAIGRDSESFKPPFAATAAIFGAIGIDLAILTGAGSQTIGFWVKMLSQKAFWPAVTATVATVVTTVSIWMGVFSDDAPKQEPQKEITQEQILETNIIDEKEDIALANGLENNEGIIDNNSRENNNSLNQNNFYKNNFSAEESNNSGARNNIAGFTVSKVPESLASTDNITNFPEAVSIPNVLISFTDCCFGGSYTNFISGYDDSFIFSQKRSPRISSGLDAYSNSLALNWKNNSVPDVGYVFDFGVYNNSIVSYYTGVNFGLSNIFDITDKSIGFGSIYIDAGAKIKYLHMGFAVPVVDLSFGYSLAEANIFYGMGGGFKFFLPDGLIFGKDLELNLKYELKQSQFKNARGITAGFNIVF